MGDGIPIMRTAQSSSRGFILPLTLWVIAAIGFAAAVLTEWVSEAVQNAVAIQEKIDADLAFANIRNELAFAFARRPYTNRGLQVGRFVSPPTGATLDDVLTANFESDRLIFMDGRPYVLSSNDDYAIKIQDGNGLVNINSTTDEQMRYFLEALDINEDDQAGLTDSLLDYRDEDDLTRLSGAEQNDYVRLGMSPPANQLLMTPWEAQRIVGWNRHNTLWDKQYERPVFSTCRANGFNPNTAPREVLSAYLNGVSTEDADQLIEYRETLPFKNARNVGDAIGIILINQPFFFSFQPGRCIVVDLINRNTNERTRFSLTLLPTQREQPWQIDYVLRIPKAYRGSLDQIDPSVAFPSPEEIAGTEGEFGGSAGF